MVAEIEVLSAFDFAQPLFHQVESFKGTQTDMRETLDGSRMEEGSHAQRLSLLPRAAHPKSDRGTFGIGALTR